MGAHSGSPLLAYTSGIHEVSIACHWDRTAVDKFAQDTKTFIAKPHGAHV